MPLVPLRVFFAHAAMDDERLPPFPGFSTDVIHGGQRFDPHSGAVTVPITLVGEAARELPVW